MTDWRAHYNARDWPWIKDWFYYSENLKEIATLREWLRRDVPRIARRNGVEETEEYVLPSVAPEEWRGAAEILHLGELDAILDEEPPSALQEWESDRTSVETELSRFIKADEVTEGDPSLSRRGHAEQAMEILDDIDQLSSWMRGELNPEDRSWLDELIAEVAHLAFSAGSHARSALGKDYERWAVRGRKIGENASKGGKAAHKARKPEISERLRRMKASIDRGFTVSAAAQHTAKVGLGSKEANERLWRRHIKQT